jgi:LacI family transcriptional regulator
MIRLREIAEKAGVSRMTVSLALRGDPQVSKETQARIRAIADELGYQPNAKVARAMAELAKSRHVEADERLAFLTSEKTEYGWKEWSHNIECFEGAKRRSLEYGYVLEPFWLRSPEMTPDKISRMLWARGIDGVMVAPLGSDFHRDGLRTFDFDWSKFSVVELDETLDEPRLDCARHDHFDGMLLALFSLESLGYRRIGLVLDSVLDVRTRHRWYSAYLLWKSVRGFSQELPVMFYDEFDVNKVQQGIRKMKLDALVSPRLTLCEELESVGIRVPDDFGVAGLDRPSDDQSGLSGISQNTEAIGSAAADLLVGLVRRGDKGIPTFPSQKICGGLWFDGATTRRIGNPLDQSSLFSSKLTGAQ